MSKIKTGKTVSSTFQVGMFTVEMTIGARKMTCEWSPHEPRIGELTKKDFKHYQKERNELVERFIRKTGT